jgi:hypothetical protein
MTATGDDVARSLVSPWPTLHIAADLFAAAATALDHGAVAEAEHLIRAIDERGFRRYWEDGGIVWEQRHDKTAHPPGSRAADSITAASRLQVAQRDGWRCRYCGLRLLSGGFVIALRLRLPEAFPTGPRDDDRHWAGSVLRYSPDHMVPHHAGGNSEPENLVASCGVCQFMKGSCTLGELGLTTPTEQPPDPTWTGLFGRLGRSEA